ncbi:MAG: ATP-binding cassette domain-containing protein [Clostridiales bacterium]|nr:ATP-binding cassette domain-containing protein [Clostridiales bacterium]
MSSIKLHNVLPAVFAGDDMSTIRNSGQHVWLSDVEFSAPGHYLLEAESGAGKSSLMSFIYGLRRDYNGVIEIDGEDIRTFDSGRWSRLRRDVLALLPQEMGLFEELTVMENIMLKNRLTDYKSGAQIEALLERLEVDDKRDTTVGMLSVGQRQRVAIVRALCQPFRYLLLDEPVSHLDERNNRLVAGLVTEEASGRGAAIITTSVGNHLALDGAVVMQL